MSRDSKTRRDVPVDQLIEAVLSLASKSDQYRILFARLYQLAGLVVLCADASKAEHDAWSEVLLDCLSDPEGGKATVMAQFDGPVQDAAKIAMRIKE